MKSTEVRSLEKYKAPGAVSRVLYERASRVMPGGNTRHSVALAPYPIYARSGSGCRITDVEGEERVDFLNNYTSLILGHAHPRVTEAVAAPRRVWEPHSPCRPRRKWNSPN